MKKTIYQDRNVKRFREMLGIKQKGLAYQLGEDWNQKKISALEKREVNDDPLLMKKLHLTLSKIISRFNNQCGTNNKLPTYF